VFIRGKKEGWFGGNLVLPSCWGGRVEATMMTEDTATMMTEDAATVTTAIHEEALVSVDTIKVEIERRLGTIQKGGKTANIRNPYRKKADEKEDPSRSYSAPAQVVALVGYLLSLLPSKTEASERATSTSEKLAVYKRLFPPGTMSFVVPKGNRTQPSDRNYAIIEGVTVHLVRWDLNFPGLPLPCCFCDDGVLVPERWDFLKNKKTHCDL
jgi:hypothetical protein